MRKILNPISVLSRAFATYGKSVSYSYSCYLEEQVEGFMNKFMSDNAKNGPTHFSCKSQKPDDYTLRYQWLDEESRKCIMDVCVRTDYVYEEHIISNITISNVTNASHIIKALGDDSTALFEL